MALDPDAMAACRFELMERAKADPLFAERLRGVLSYARAGGARLVADGMAPAAFVARVCLTTLAGDLPRQMFSYFGVVVQRRAREILRELDDAEDWVCYMIGPMLDAGAPAQRIRAAALDHAGPLALWQVDLILAREQAWWVRLHAQLDVAHAA